MNKKTTIKVLLDVFMTIIFLLLLNLNITGLLFHEIAGLGIIFFIIIHNLLNIKFIINISKNIYKIKNKKQLLMYILIAIGVLVIVVTGIFISNYIFPNISTSNTMIFSKLHHLFSYITLALIGVHILLHLKYLLASFKNILKNIKSGEVKKTIFLCFAVMFICIILYIPISSVLKINKNDNNSTSHDNELAYVEKSDYQSLDDYLSSLRCTGCNKHCLLISPQCNTGASQAKEATEEYNSNIKSSDNSNSDESVKDKNSEKLQKPNKNKEDNNSSDNIKITYNEEDNSGLSEYLSKLKCTGCNKHCSLLYPKCGKGMKQAEEATTEYNKSNINSNTTDSDV